MTLLARLLSDNRGTTVTEFALLAPMFFLLLLGTIEASRLVWTQQTLDEVAYATARCTSIGTTCDTAANRKAFAVARAASYGVTVAVGDVTPDVAGTCNGFSGSSVVTITHTFNSVIDGFIPHFPANLTSEACYPTLAPAP